MKGEISMDSIEILKEKIKIAEDNFYKEYEDESSWANDLLEYSTDIISLKNRLIEALEADLRGKNNEIADLKARIKYLGQFKPVEKDEPTIKD
jgi:hypothetical protein